MTCHPWSPCQQLCLKIKSPFEEKIAMSLVHYLRFVLIVFSVSPVFATHEKELNVISVDLESGEQTSMQDTQAKYDKNTTVKDTLIKYVGLPCSVFGILALATTVFFAPIILESHSKMPTNIGHSLCPRICAQHNEFYIPKGNSLIKGYCNQTVDFSSVVNVSVADIGILSLGKGFVCTAFNHTPICNEASGLLTAEINEIVNELGHASDDMPSLVSMNIGE